MTAEADEPRKRRKYTTAERLEILKTADKVGPIEAARHHGVPQTTVSNWLHRDATKVAREVGAQEAGARADESKPTRTRRAATPAISKAPVGSMAKVEPAMKAATAPLATVTATKAATKAAVATTMLPKPGTPLPDSL